MNHLDQKIHGKYFVLFLAFMFIILALNKVAYSAANFGDCSSGTAGCFEDKAISACALCHDTTITRSNGTVRKVGIAQSPSLQLQPGVFPGPRSEGSPSDPAGNISWWATVNYMLNKGCPIGGDHSKLGGGSTTSVEAVNAANYLGANYCPTCTGVILSSVDLANITTTSAAINWNTSLAGYQDGLANSVVFWGTSPSALTNQVSDPTATGMHSVSLTGLNPGTKYYFSYQSTGANGVTVKWPDVLSFKTAAASGGGGGGTTTTTYAYVVNQVSHSISVLNTATKAVQTTIFLTETPYGIASSPDGKTVYVSAWYVNGTADPNLPYNVNDLVVIDTATNSIRTVVGDIFPNYSGAPTGLALSPDGKYLFGVNSAQLFVFSTTTLTLVKQTALPTSYALDLAVTPDGKWIYIVSGSYFSDTEIVDLASAVNPSVSTIVSRVTMPSVGSLGPGASSVAAGPDGRGWIPGNIGGGPGGFTILQPNGLTSLVTSDYSGPGVTINAAGDTVYSTTRDYKLNGGMSSVGVAQLDTGTLATQFMFPDPLGNYSYNGIAVSPDGSTIYVSAVCGGTPPCSDLLYFIDTASFSVTGSVPVGSGPNKIAIASVVTGTPAGPPPTLIYSANGAANNVSVIDPATNTITATIPVGTNPLAVAPTADGKWVVVVNGDGSVSVVTRSTQTVTATFALPDPVTGKAAAIAGPAGTNIVYIANHNAMKIYVMNTQTNTITATIPVGGPAIYSPQGPLDLAITPDGQTLYANVDVSPGDFTNADGYVAVIQTSSNTLVGRIILPVTGSGIYHSGGNHIVMNPLGGYAYVSADPYAVVLETGTDRIVTTLKTAAGSAKCSTIALGVTPDGSALAVSCWSTLFLYDTSTLLQTLNSANNIPNIISSIAMTGDSAKGYLSGDNTTVVTNVDMTTLGVMAGIAVPGIPSMIAASPAVSSVPGGTPLVLSAPDLAFTALSATSPVNLSTSPNMTITDTVKNLGGSNAGSFKINYYLSPQNIYNPSTAILIGSQTVGSLNAGASASLSLPVTIPPTVATGDYYLLAYADVNQQIAETNEDNNIASTSSTVHLVVVDLVETNITSPAIGTGQLPGASISVTDTVTNQGSASSGSFTVGIYLYPTGAGSITFLGGRSVSGLASGGSSTGTITVKIPSNVSGGTYYLRAAADYNNLIPESNESNNIYTNTSGVITLPPADLIMTSVSTTATSVVRGGTVSLSYMVKNQGSGGASAFRVGFYLSTDNTITTGDKLLTYVDFKSGLNSGNSFSGSVTVTIPTTVSVGNYYLGAYADYMNAVAESNESNNGLATSGTIQVK